MKFGWVFTWRIDPNDLQRVVSGRTGGSVMFVAYSRVIGWLWVFPGGEKKIPAPDMLFLDLQWAREHQQRLGVRARPPVRLRARKEKAVQIELGL